MSTCPNEEFCSAFVDDEMPPLLKEKFELHLSQCEECRRIVSKYNLLRSILIYDESPDLDLDQSFAKFLLKRNSIKKGHYNLFPVRIKYRMIVASAVAGVFLFAFLFVLLQRHSSYDKVYTLNKGKVEFIPIVPMSYRQHNSVITNIDLHNMTNVVKTNKKYNNRIYRNFTNTFNSFSTLYTPVDDNINNFAVTMPNINVELPYAYRINMSIYENLNKDAK